MTKEEIKRALECAANLLNDNRINAIAERARNSALPLKDKGREDDVRAAELAGYVCALRLGEDLINAVIKEI